MDTIKEKDIQRACLDYLDAKRIMYLRLNAGDTFRPGANGKLYKVRGAKKGTADLLVLAQRFQYDSPRPIFIEFKSSKGKPTVEQKEFEAAVKALSYEYYLIRSIDELLEVLK